MIIILFIIGILTIIFGVYNLTKEKDAIAIFLLLIGVGLLVIGYIIAHIYPQTLPEFLRVLHI